MAMNSKSSYISTLSIALFKYKYKYMVDMPLNMDLHKKQAQKAECFKRFFAATKPGLEGHIEDVESIMNAELEPWCCKINLREGDFTFDSDADELHFLFHWGYWDEV